MLHQTSIHRGALTAVTCGIFCIVGRASATMSVIALPGTVHYFVERDDLPNVKLMLRRHPALKEQRQSFLGTPLAVAATDGKLDLVRYLISQKVYVNARCPDQYDSQTVLMAACTGGDFSEGTRLEIVKELVTAGALVRVVDRSGYTALHTAAYYGHADVVNYLILKGADLLALDQDGRTPFTEAMRGASLWDDWRLMRFIRVAIAAGANVNAQTAAGETMIDLAARSGKVHALEYLLLQGADVQAKDRSGKTALEIALEHGQADAAEILKQHGAVLPAIRAASGVADGPVSTIPTH
jgi:ankyrin repeat protein